MIIIMIIIIINTLILQRVDIIPKPKKTKEQKTKKQKMAQKTKEQRKQTMDQTKHKTNKGPKISQK